MEWKSGGARRSWGEDTEMMGHNSLRRRVVGDFALVGAFGIVAPALLAPINRHWSVMLVAFAAFAIAVGFLVDGLRTLDRLNK